MKSITGRSALDTAITATRTMIDRMDELLLEMGDELGAEVTEIDERRNGAIRAFEVGSHA